MPGAFEYNLELLAHPGKERMLCMHCDQYELALLKDGNRAYFGMERDLREKSQPGRGADPRQ